MQGNLGLSALLVLAACANDAILGPYPPPTAHFTAEVDGVPFVGFVPAPGCIGLQISPTHISLSAHVLGAPTGSGIALDIGGLTRAGSYLILIDRPAHAT